MKGRGQKDHPWAVAVALAARQVGSTVWAQRKEPRLCVRGGAQVKRPRRCGDARMMAMMMMPCMWVHLGGLGIFVSNLSI